MVRNPLLKLVRNVVKVPFCGFQSRHESRDDGGKCAIYYSVEQDGFSDDDSYSATPLLTTHAASRRQRFYPTDPRESNFLHQAIEVASPIFDNGRRQVKSHDSGYEDHFDGSPENPAEDKMHQRGKPNHALKLENASLRRELRKLGDSNTQLEERATARIQELENLLHERPAHFDNIYRTNKMEGNLEASNPSHEARKEMLTADSYRSTEVTTTVSSHHQAALQRLNEENASLRADNDHISMVNDQLNTKIYRANEEASAILRDREAAFQRLEGEKNTLKVEHRYACGLNEKLNTELYRVKNEASANLRGYEETIQLLEDEIDTLTADNHSIWMANEELNTKLLHATEETNAIFFNQRERIQHFRNENSTLRSQLYALRQQMAAASPDEQPALQFAPSYYRDY